MTSLCWWEVCCKYIFRWSSNQKSIFCLSNTHLLYVAWVSIKRQKRLCLIYYMCASICVTGLLSGAVPVWGGSLWQCSRSDPILCGWASAHLPSLRRCDLSPNHTDPSSACHHWATCRAQKQQQQRWQQSRWSGGKTLWIQQKTQLQLCTHRHTAGHQSAAEVGGSLLKCSVAHIHIYSAETHCMYTNTKIIQRHVHELYFTRGRSGSQPANLENVGRRPSLQSAQSDSNLRTGTLSSAFNLYIHTCVFHR